jgi:hypothetical protein
MMYVFLLILCFHHQNFVSVGHVCTRCREGKEGPYSGSCYEARVQLSLKFIQYIMGVLGFGEKFGGGGGERKKGRGARVSNIYYTIGDLLCLQNL